MSTSTAGVEPPNDSTGRPPGRENGDSPHDAYGAPVSHPQSKKNPPFGEYLRFKRSEAGMSLSELARRLDVSKAYLCRVELSQDQTPTVERCREIARILNLDPQYLIALAGRVPDDVIRSHIEGVLNEPR